MPGKEARPEERSRGSREVSWNLVGWSHPRVQCNTGGVEKAGGEVLGVQGYHTQRHRFMGSQVRRRLHLYGVVIGYIGERIKSRVSGSSIYMKVFYSSIHLYVCSFITRSHNFQVS